ncbi:MAG: AzlC family ABC transporter permease [Clostridia bacterium]|nr:AzlC family ABC transporter permease [Clostridia bacterium]
MRKIWKTALIATVPVMTGYLVLGFGFGIVLRSGGHSILTALAMSVFIYAGSMQYAALGLFAAGASPLTVFFTTVMVNARHLFYGISMLDRYKNTGKYKPYLIFALTDETYSLVCHDTPDIAETDRTRYWFLVSLFNHIYWVTGSLLGAVIGSLVRFNSEGIDFALTALFVCVFVEQWMHTKRHAPALIGLGVTAGCLLLFGQDQFLIPAMLVVAVLLCLMRGEEHNA